MKPQKEGAVHEYNALRSEILLLLNQRTSSLNIAWACISALIAAGAISKIPEFGCLALLAVSSSWLDESNRISAMTKTGIYIKLFLEPNLEGAQWEYVNDLFRSKDKERSAITRIVREIFSTYGLFSLICIVATIIFSIEFPVVTPFRITLLISLSLISILFWMRAFKRALFRSPRKIWERNYREALKQMGKKDSRAKNK